MSVSVINNTKDDIVSTQSRTILSPVLLHIFACVSMCDFVQVTSTYLSNYLENSTRYSAEGKKGPILTLSVESRCYNFSFCIKETTDASAGVWYFCCVAWYLINKDAYYLFITLQNAKCMDPSNASFFFCLNQVNKWCLNLDTAPVQTWILPKRLLLYSQQIMQYAKFAAEELGKNDAEKSILVFNAADLKQNIELEDKMLHGHFSAPGR